MTVCMCKITNLGPAAREGYFDGTNTSVERHLGLAAPAAPEVTPEADDITSQIVRKCGNKKARWVEAISQNHKAGTLVRSPKDIGLLVNTIKDDIINEHGDAIKQMLWDHHRRAIMREVLNGLPEWYKQQLSEGGFDDG